MKGLLRSAAALGLLAALVWTATASAETTVSDLVGDWDSAAPAEYGACASDCCPLWTAQAGAVILHRSAPEESEQFAIFDAFGESDFDFGWAAGLEVSLARRLRNGDSVELRYFGLLDWDAEEAVDLPPLSVDGVYSSQLNSTELNWRRRVSPHFAWLAGLRMVLLHEEFETAISLPPISASNTFDTDNHLYGGQIGGQVDFCLLGGPLAVSGVMKAGAYGNYADHQFISVFNSSTIALPRADDWHAAFVGEIGVTATYPLTDRLSVRGGYQLLWLDGVALASEQDFPFPASTVDTSGHVFYHGALVGLELAW